MSTALEEPKLTVDEQKQEEPIAPESATPRPVLMEDRVQESAPKETTDSPVPATTAATVDDTPKKEGDETANENQVAENDVEQKLQQDEGEEEEEEEEDEEETAKLSVKKPRFTLFKKPKIGHLFRGSKTNVMANEEGHEVVEITITAEDPVEAPTVVNEVTTTPATAEASAAAAADVIEESTTAAHITEERATVDMSAQENTRRHTITKRPSLISRLLHIHQNDKLPKLEQKKEEETEHEDHTKPEGQQKKSEEEGEQQQQQHLKAVEEQPEEEEEQQKKRQNRLTRRLTSLFQRHTKMPRKTLSSHNIIEAVEVIAEEDPAEAEQEQKQEDSDEKKVAAEIVSPGTQPVTAATA